MIAVLITYFLLATLAYGRLPLTFFLQDEWFSFGKYLYWDKAGLSWFHRLFVDQFTHLIPLSNIISYAQFKLFSLNFSGYGIVSILLQVCNALLIYWLALILLKRRSVAFIAGLLFLVNAIPRQSVTWIATTTGTVGSAFFVLIALIFMVYYFQKNRKPYFFTSLFFLIISLLFKETSIFLFLFLPAFFIIYKKKYSRKDILEVISPFFLTGLLYISFRVFFRIFFIVNSNIINSAPQSFSQPGFSVYIYRLLTVPLKTLGQSIVPVDYVIVLARKLVMIAYPQFVQFASPNPFVVESIGSDLVSYAIAFIILIVCGVLIFAFRRLKKEEYSQVLFVSIVFIILSSLPLVIIPGRAGYFSLIDGRDLYMTSIFVSILFGVVMGATYELISKRIIFRTVFVLILASYSLVNVWVIRKDINHQVEVGDQRKYILTQISTKYPILPRKTVFYMESDKAFYGVEEKIFPFQSGLGQTLLVWYNQHGNNIPSCFFKDRYLYDLLEQGYRDCEGKGIGYFREMETLKKAMNTYKLQAESIVAFRFSSVGNVLTDITPSLQKEFRK